MKLTAKLLKKIIREAVKGGVPGIGKYYDEDDMKLPVDYAKQGAELSGMLGSDVEQTADDVDESILIELKEIIADFVDQYYRSFLSDVLEAEGGDNYPDEYDGMEIIKGRIESFIDKTHFTNPITLQNKIMAVTSMAMFRNRSLKPMVRRVRNKMRANPRFYSSYDDLYDAVANEEGKAPDLEKLNIEKEVNEAIQEFKESFKLARKLKIQPIENYKNYIRLANSKEQIVKIFSQLENHLQELLRFIGEKNRRYFNYSGIGAPLRYTIDPELVSDEHEFYSTKAPRKQIETENNMGKKKSMAQIVDEVEKYIAQRVAGEFVSRYGEPMVQQKMMPDKFPMTEAKLKKMIFEELTEMHKGKNN